MNDKIEGFLPDEALQHYGQGTEAERLINNPYGQLERIRSQEIIKSYLPAPPAVVYDIGGGPGLYSVWLLGLGYEVHLIDAVKVHTEQAQNLINEKFPNSKSSAKLGDAKNLEFADESADAVLLMGPLYHLTNYNERIQALKEARRVLKPEGYLFAVGISRFASSLDGLFSNLFNDPDFAEIAVNDLERGQHRNPNNKPGYFTTTFFHHPEELKKELEDSGLQFIKTLSIEGPAWLLPHLNTYLENQERQDLLMEILRKTEAESSMLGVSAHMMAIARK